MARERLGEITRADIHELLDGIADRPAPVLANRIYAHLRTLCRWALARGVIAANPCEGMTRPAEEKPRDRVPDDRELALIWKSSRFSGWPFCPIVRLLILTGQRRSEIAEGRWAEIDFDTKVWRLASERTKNKREHTIPLSPQALAILNGLPHMAGGDLLFSTTGETSVSGFSRMKRRLDAAIAALNGGAPIAAWTIHDIRRGVVSSLASIDVQLPVIERIVNHISGSFAGVAGIYQRHQFEPRSAPPWSAGRTTSSALSCEIASNPDPPNMECMSSIVWEFRFLTGHVSCETCPRRFLVLDLYRCLERLHR